MIVDFWRDFWIRETETGQQVAQLHDDDDGDDDDDDIRVFYAFHTSLLLSAFLALHIIR